MSKLLINESPLQVLPTLAKYIGLNEAIVLQQIHYWLTNPKVGYTDGNGIKWVRNSIQEWQSDNFPFWSEKLIARTLNNLVEDGLIWWTDGLNKRNKDRTRWYTINYDALDVLDRPMPRLTGKTQKRQAARNGGTPPEDTIGQNVTLSDNRTNCPHPIGQIVPTQSDKLSPALPETTTETHAKNHDNARAEKIPAPTDINPQYGEIIKLYEARFGRINMTTRTEIDDIYDEIDPPPGETKLGWFQYAIAEAYKIDRSPSWGLVKAIIVGGKKPGIQQYGSIAAHRDAYSKKRNDHHWPKLHDRSEIPPAQQALADAQMAMFGGDDDDG